jgi:hypothetical protein
MARAMCVYQDNDPDRKLESVGKDGKPITLWKHWSGEADAALSAFRTWLDAEGLVVVPIHSTLQMDEAGSKEAQMAHAEGISVDAEVMWDFMIAAAPDVLGKP